MGQAARRWERVKARDLVGGGAFRWLVRVLTLGTVLLVPLLNFLLGINVIISALIGFTVLLLGLLIIWALAATGRIKIEL